MAGIDKTYITKKQYIIARKWWLDNREKMKKELGFIQWLYPFQIDEKYNVNTQREFFEKNTKDIDNFIDDSPLWNTSSYFDLWLIKNCELDFIKDRLKLQYGDDFWGFKFKDELDFSKKPFILSIEKNRNDIKDGGNSFLYFFRNTDEKGIIETIDNVVFYGTTYFLKVFNEGLDILKGIRGNNTNVTVCFDFHGLLIKSTTNKTVIIKEEKEEEIDFIYINEIKDVFELPTIKHSYDINDEKDYKVDEIFMSHEYECYDITQYKDFEKDKLKRYILFLPEYVRNLILNY